MRPIDRLAASRVAGRSECRRRKSKTHYFSFGLSQSLATDSCETALACEPGRYRHRPGSSAAVPAQAACAFCPAGKHQSASAAAGCDACPAGRYQYLAPLRAVPQL
jgi:hypothetical protein